MTQNGTRKDNWLSELPRVLTLEGQALLECAQRLAEPGSAAAEQARHALKLMGDALAAGGKIIVTGVGKSGKVGQKIAATLSSTGSLAVFLHPTEGLHGDLGLVRAGDVVLALSYTGNTEELIRLLPSLKGLKVPVIGLGGNRASKLATQCDAWIDGQVGLEACPHNLAPTTSTTLALALGDALAMALMQMRGFDAESFARLHPGGSLGGRLTLRVADVMHSGDAVGIVVADASMDEVVLTATRKALGGVLVVDGPKLLGLIVEGDIRRALRHREKFFSLKASEIMTASPVTVEPALMAKAALEVMENRPKPLSVLPVVEKDGSWKGLVRIHDLVRTF